MKITIRLSWILLLLVLLSGCGTLKIDIDLGEVSPAAVSTTPSAVTRTGTAVSTPTASPTAGESSATPEQAAPTPEKIFPIALAAGRNFTCAAMHSGGVKCWGNNEHGQLGNGTRVNSNEPVDASGLTGVKALAAGWGHVCALTEGGAVKCWGYNANGELGDGRTTDSATPVDVTGLGSDVEAIDAGDDHTCAVIRGGGLRCWGINTYGQLGDWTKVARSVPVDSPWFGGGVADVQAGWGHTCVRTTAGWAKCWGNNEYGQLGFGKLTDIHLPAEDVVNLSGKILDVTADGGQTCALIAGGGAYCWGNNRYGQLGDGTTQKQYAPVAVAGLSTGVSLLKTGWNHTCAVVSGGELRCWGWNYFGQLGEGTTLNRYTPARVQNLTDGVKDIALGWGHTCVVTDLGAVKCWGSNESGQLGDGTWADSKVPLTVIGLAPGLSPTQTAAGSPTNQPAIRSTSTHTPSYTGTHTPSPAGSRALAVSMGDVFTCALMSGGVVKCWGNNTYGELGNGTTKNSHLPVTVRGLSGEIATIAAGGAHACALRTDGTVQCWGKNASGQLGGGFTSNSSNIPVEVENIHGPVKSIALGTDHTCALTGSGGVKCWGWNYSGQLGDGTNNESKIPVDVVGLSGGVIAISARYSTSCALLKGGAVKCWGWTVGDPSSDGVPTDSNVPVPIKGLTSGMVRISVGCTHACALTDKGGAKCWWRNIYGQLGIGRTSPRENPVDVIEPENDFLDIKAGDAFTCALTKAGGVKCWGSVNEAHLYEAPSFTNQTRPVDVIGLSGIAAFLEVGWGNACVISTDGTVRCWGSNRDGQLGDGTTVNRFAPGVVIDL